MTLYYFDRREDGHLFPDTVGVEFPDQLAAEREVIHAVYDVARDGWRDGVGHVMIELRDASGPLMAMAVNSRVTKPSQ